MLESVRSKMLFSLSYYCRIQGDSLFKISSVKTHSFSTHFNLYLPWSWSSWLSTERQHEPIVGIIAQNTTLTNPCSFCPAGLFHLDLLNKLSLDSRAPPPVRHILLRFFASARGPECPGWSAGWTVRPVEHSWCLSYLPGRTKATLRWTWPLVPEPRGVVRRFRCTFCSRKL